MILPFDIILIVTIVSILLIVSFNLKNPITIPNKLNKFIFKWWYLFGLFFTIFILCYAFNLRGYANSLKYTVINEYGQEVELYKTDNNLIYQTMPDGSIIDLTGNYAKQKEMMNKMWYMVGFGYFFAILYIIYNRKNVIERWHNSKIYGFINQRRIENENNKIEQ